MKQSNKSIFLFIPLALIIIGVLVFAGFHSKTLNLPRKSSTTQQALKQELAHNLAIQMATPKLTNPSRTDNNSSSSATVGSSATPTSSSAITTGSHPVPQLANTGPGNLIPIFLFGTIIGYMAHRWRNRSVVD